MTNRYDNYRGERRSQFGEHDDYKRQSHQFDQSSGQADEYVDAERRDRRWFGSSHDGDGGANLDGPANWERPANWDRGNDQRQQYRGTTFGDGFDTRAGSAQGYDRSSRHDRYGSDRYGSDRYGSERYGSGNYGPNRYDRPSPRQSYERDYRQANDYAGDRHDHDRGFFVRAGDEIASWFGDDDAARRREADHRGSGPQNYARSDERILDDVCDRLTEDRYVDARNVTVTVQDCEVTLDGTVASKAAKRRAEDCTDAVSGVRHVQNNLRVSDRFETDSSQAPTITTPSI